MQSLPCKLNCREDRTHSGQVGHLGPVCISDISCTLTSQRDEKNAVNLLRCVFPLLLITKHPAFFLPVFLFSFFVGGGGGRGAVQVHCLLSPKSPDSDEVSEEP